MRHLAAALTFCFFALFAQVAAAQERGFSVGEKHITLTDETRLVKAANGFAGAPVRRIDVTVWYPAEPARSAKSAAKPASPRIAKGGPWPLIIYSHGTYGWAANASHLVSHLVRAGYVVAAPDYPLTSRAAYTKVTGADISDVAQQTRDIRFIIDKLLAHAELGPAIDASQIGTTGHSLGAVTSYFASFGGQTRDPRIKAVALTGAGDPVQAALSADMGLTGTWNAAVSVPVLFLSAEKDVFARITGRPYAAFSRLEAPKYEAMIRRGVHVRFGDNADEPADGTNPDCRFFAAAGMKVPGCDDKGPFLSPARQQAINRAVVLAFFDAYLKDDAAQRARLRSLPAEFPEIDARFEE